MPPTPSNLNIPEILRVGLAGLCFLLALLAFWLIWKEQQRPGAARNPILRAVYIFMGLNFLTGVLVGSATYMDRKEDPTMSKRLATVEADLTKSDELNGKYKLALTSLATTVDGKVQYEMGEVEAGHLPLPALRVYINQLKQTMEKAKANGLIDK